MNDDLTIHDVFSRSYLHVSATFNGNYNDFRGIESVQMAYQDDYKEQQGGNITAIYRDLTIHMH